MNTSFSTLNPDDPRLTALACGEITDPAEVESLRAAIARDPALQREFEAIIALQASLQKEFGQESERMPKVVMPRVARQAAEAPPRRRQHASFGGGLGGGKRPKRKLSPGEKIINFVFLGGAGVSIAAMIYFAFQPAQTTPTGPDAEALLATRQPSRDVWIKVRLPKTHEERVASRTSDTAVASDLHRVKNTDALADLVRRLPVCVPGGGENEFIATRGAGLVALNLSSAGQTYARRLQSSLAEGRLPARKLVRIDGLVNAFLANGPRSTEPGIRLIVEAVPAPWADGHWLVRATVHAGEIDGTVVATDVRAAVSFEPAQVASWRMLGCEDGDAEAVALDVPGIVRAGESLTTLFELVPAPGVTPDRALGELRMTFIGKDGKPVALMQAVAYPASDGLAKASDDMRFAAAVASFGLAVRDSQYRGGASLVMAGRLAEGVKNPNKKLFDDLMREAAPLVR